MPLKILFFDLCDPLDSSNWSGTPAQIIECLRKAGITVILAGPHYLFFRKSINWIAYQYFRYFRKLFYHIDRHLFWVRLFTKLANRRLMAYDDADAIVTAFPAFAAFVRPGLPIFMIHDATWGQVVESYPWFSVDHQPKRIVADGLELERIAYHRKDVFPVLTSGWAAERAIQDYGADPHRISILPLGPNLKHPPEKATVEAAIGRRGAGPCKLLFVGKEWTRKGGPLAVAATAALIKMGVPTELHVVGPAEMPPGSNHKVGLPDFVRLYGFLKKDVNGDAEKLEKLFLQSDFFLLPTQAEALGVVFAEAAAYGLPSLGTRVGGVPAVLREGVGGALFAPAGSEREMASWIKEVFLDRDRYRMLAKSARMDYETRLSSIAYGTQLAKIIRQTVAARALSESGSANAVSDSANAAPRLKASA